jgi:hypothetical protein
MNDDLKNKAKQIWSEVLEKSFEGRQDLSKDYISLSTDDIYLGVTAFAAKAGIDLEKFSKALVSKNNSNKNAATLALKTVFEVEKYYEEIPNAFTLFKVRSDFLIVFGAALIGIATEKTTQINPILAGTVSGVGGLLINILAARYEGHIDEEVDWLEEFVLKVLEAEGGLAFNDLKTNTNINEKLLRKVLRDLQRKQMIDKKHSWVGRT